MTLTGPAPTLYVSDLDGTLLGADGLLSAASRSLLAGLLDGGVAFTAATARSATTARRALDGLRLEQPMVVYSGATAVDPAGRHLWWHHFDARVLSPLIGATLAAGVTPLVFHLDGDAERISWVRGAETAGVDAFLDARPGDERIRPVDGWDEIDHERAFFVSIVGEYPVLRRLARMIRAISWGSGCAIALQPDGDDSGLAVLDVTAAAATKGAGARRVADDGGFVRIVAFGDGANDLSLFAEADESYAVAAALDEVKAAATEVLPARPDAVARALAERLALGAEA